MSRFFIDRPIFASVLSLLILLLGGLAIVALPIAQYPEITPPTIRIKATYPGASAETVAQSLAAPIEQQLSGATDLISFSSQCTNDGQLTTTATFAIGTDQDLANVDVQNRVKLAEPKLPQEALRQGVVVQKTSTNMLVVLSLQSSDPRFDELYLSNYATANVVDTLKRVPGAGDVVCYGAKDYAMRVWLDPDRLAQKGMTVADVRAAVAEQNGLYAAGRVGQEPNEGDAQLTVPVISRGRLETPEEFAGIILRAGADGSVVRISDVGRVELGSQSYDLFGRLDGKPGTLLIVYLQAGANALAVKEQVVATMDELAKSFPAGIAYTLPYDTTKFIEVSVEEVVHTLFEAVVLVLLVVFLFLQSVRATLVPLCAVPVAIVGTFAGMMALGFTINSLTLFGLVLAIGIVVDDAIVVVENVERLMHERKLSVRDATIAAMQEVTGPVIAIVLVLCAVFVPVAFLGGITGQMYQQFAITIAVSVAISGLVALTLSPAMCVLLLKPAHGPRRGFFGWFNRVFDAATAAYTATVRGLLRVAVVGVLVFGALCFGTYKLFGMLPSGFVPPEDQGYFLVAGVLPEGASLGRTSALAGRVEKELLATPGVRNVLTLGGQNVLAGSATATNAFTIFAMLEPWEARKVAEKRLRALLVGFNLRWRGEPDGVVLAFNPPPVPGLGTRVGFEFQLQQRGRADTAELAKVSDAFVARLRQRPEMSGLSTNLGVTLPQVFLDLDRERALRMGVPIGDVYMAMQAFLSSLYVNDFVKDGRIYRVNLQAEPKARTAPESIGRFEVRARGGAMVPLASLVATSWRNGPNFVSRFNAYPAVPLAGAPAAGFSTGDCIRVLREEAAKLPEGYAYEWSGQTYQEIAAGSQASLVLLLGMVVVFLLLAAQYESWLLPVAVLLAVPLAVFGALVATAMRGLEVDIYFQIGLLTLVGLAAKNAILIVEFAVVLQKEGRSVRDAAIEAARLRFRPILMTSLAFVLGVVPLVIADGAGAAGRHSIGTGVLGGMIAATVLAVLFVPLWFFLLRREQKPAGDAPATSAHAPEPAAKPAPDAGHGPAA
ncbi:MAG: multidrug efflux RND transporter permease subunit [Planctomycetota bacterium]